MGRKYNIMGRKFPPEVGKFVVAFDQGVEVSPFEFEYDFVS